MAKDKNHIEPIKELSQEQMKAYAEGSLSSAEQYQVEKYLLEHPFEAEAMEGYLDNPLAFSDLQSLNEKLEERLNQGKEKAIIPLWRKALPYAAVLLLLIISTVFTINFFQRDKSFAPLAIEADDALKFEKETNSVSPPKAYQADADAKQDEEQASDTEPYVDAAKEQEPQQHAEAEEELESIASQQPITPDEDLFISDISELKEIELEDNVVDQLQGKVAGVQVEKSKLQSKKRERTSLVASEEIPATYAEVPSERNSRNTVVKTGVVTGMVLDAETEEPLPGVNVLLKGTGIGSNTDLEGNFEITAAVDDILVVSFIGMQKQEHLIRDLDEIEIFMNADVAQLSEVVVTGYGAEKDEDNTYSPARPIIGFSAYRDYLKENLQYPEEAQEAGTEGKVRLKVSINANGVFDEVEVLKSLGDGCDEEAIRLVKEGPKWQAAKKGAENVPSTRRITVRFEMK